MSGHEFVSVDLRHVLTSDWEELPGEGFVRGAVGKESGGSD